MPITYHNKKEEKMLSRKKRIKQMNFQTANRVRELEPLSENDKYIIESVGYRKQELRGQSNEDISRTTGRSIRPEYI